MQFNFKKAELNKIVDSNFDESVMSWLASEINLIIENKSTKKLYLLYSLLASKVPVKLVQYNEVSHLTSYLENQKMNTLELSRIFLLIEVLEADSNFFESKVANLIQVADKTELETFLKYLILLPKPEAYKNVAVDALRTNIGSVFNAIALNNPYPAIYFNDKQWSQMYLKTIFIESNLGGILNVDERANEDLARIISDYAHERWAAGRKIDPLFWRPVTKFLNETLLLDIKRLLESDDELENVAGILCCKNSENSEALKMLDNYPELVNSIDNKKISWDNLNA